MHGGAFLTCGVNSHGRLVTALSRYADCPVLVVNYRMIPKHSVGQALDDVTTPTNGADRGMSLTRSCSPVIRRRLPGAGAGRTTPARGDQRAKRLQPSPRCRRCSRSTTSRAEHPNTRTDVMFPPKAFRALVDLIEAASAARWSTEGRRGLRAARPHRARPPRTLIHVSGSEVLVSDARKAARHGGCGGARRGPCLAWSDARLPTRRTRGFRGEPIAAPDRRVHPRGHLVVARAGA